MLLFEVLEVVEGTTKKRRKIEQKYLNQIQDWATIYNIKKKTVEKLGPWSSTPEETKKKMSEAHKGKKHTKETKKKISLSKKGKKNPNFGKSLPTEIKIKLSKALKGRKQTDEHVEKRISKLRGHVNKQAIINGKKVSKPVYQFDKNGILIAKFSSLTEASLKCN